MQVECVSVDQLRASDLDIWRRIAYSCEPFNPFFLPEFTQTVAGCRADVEVAVVTSDEGPLGFLPFHRTRPRKGVAIGSFMNDIQALICADPASVDITSLMAGCRLDTFCFDHLLATQETFADHFFELDPCYCVDLSHGFAGYERSKRAAGSSFIKQARRKSRKLDREVGELHLCWDDDTADLVEQLIDWKRLQIGETEQAGSLQIPWVEALIKSVAAAKSQHFASRLSSLRAGGEVIALHLAVQSADVLNSWIPTINPRFTHYSAGTVLHWKLLEEAARRGIKRVDLGRGENQLKIRSATHTIPLAIGTVERKRYRKLGLQSYYRMKQVAKSVPLGKRARQVIRQFAHKVAGIQS